MLRASAIERETFSRMTKTSSRATAYLYAQKCVSFYEAFTADMTDFWKELEHFTMDSDWRRHR